MNGSTTTVAGQAAGAPGHLDDALKAERIQELLRQLPGWTLLRGGAALTRQYTLPGYRSTLAFVNFVSELAHDQGLAADLDVWSDRVGVTLTNRTVRRLTLAEFNLAKAIDGRE